MRRKSSDSINSNEEESDTEPSPTMVRQGRRKAIFDSRVSVGLLFIVHKVLYLTSILGHTDWVFPSTTYSAYLSGLFLRRFD